MARKHDKRRAVVMEAMCRFELVIGQPGGGEEIVISFPKLIPFSLANELRVVACAQDPRRLNAALEHVGRQTSQRFDSHVRPATTRQAG